MAFLQRHRRAALITFIVVIMMRNSPIAAQQNDPLEIYFDFDSILIDGAVDAALADVAAALAEGSMRPIRVVGHADAPGAVGYNDTLGLRRAEAVAARLVALGAPPASLSVASLGETAPRVSTPDRERANRRVTLTPRACVAWRDIPSDEALRADLASLAAQAVAARDARIESGTGDGAYLMANAAVRSCGVASGYVEGEARREEYARRCVCDSDRLRAAALETQQ